MFFDDAKRIARNPKILIPVAILAIIAFFIERSIEPKNPLPHPSTVVKLTMDGKELPLDRYSKIYECLENANRLIHGPQGEILTDMLIHQKKGEPIKFVVNEFTIVQIGSGIYESDTSQQSNDLYSIILDISDYR